LKELKRTIEPPILGKLIFDTLVNFKNYGDLIIPKNTQVRKIGNSFVVNEFGWIGRNYPELSKILLHDATYYGIHVKSENVQVSKPIDN
jgi:hypothetical protein